MERLCGIDAGFLYMETPTVHMHTIKAAVMEPDGGSRYSLDKVKHTLRERLHLLPAFRRRVIEVPFHLHHPVWIEDPQFDLDRHVRWRSLPAPAGTKEIEAAISEIASTPLKRDRPLWEISILEGLPDGSVVFVAKIHHTLADGLAAAQMLANVTDPQLGETAAPAGEKPWNPDPVPGRSRLVADALRDHLPPVRRFPALAARTARNLVAVARNRRAAAIPPPRPLLDTPKTPLNGTLTARRRFLSLGLSLDSVKKVKNVLGVSVNDVLLGLVASSLRDYLTRRGELPARPLLAEVPMALDRPGEQRSSGNRVSNLFTSLCTDEPDPIRRVRRIHETIEATKRANEILGPDMYHQWSEYTPPAFFPLLVRLYSRTRLANRLRPPINVIVSSVRGPRAPLHLRGGSLRSIYSVGPLIEGVALNITAWSYVDQLNVGLLACPDLVDRPDEIADGIRAALDELLIATAQYSDPARRAG